jgi:hypothetical protein
VRIKPKNNWLAWTPLGFGLLFIVLMILVALISTEKARRHYQAKKMEEALYKIGQINPILPKINFPDNKPTPLPTPTPTPKPAPEKSWSQKIVYYDIPILITALPVFLLGLRFAGLSLGTLKLKNKAPDYKDPLILINFYVMVACLALSFSLLLFYIWSLRVGLIA